MCVPRSQQQLYRCRNLVHADECGAGGWRGGVGSRGAVQYAANIQHSGLEFKKCSRLHPDIHTNSIIQLSQQQCLAEPLSPFKQGAQHPLPAPPYLANLSAQQPRRLQSQHHCEQRYLEWKQVLRKRQLHGQLVHSHWHIHSAVHRLW